jgi:hypothetical protein
VSYTPRDLSTAERHVENAERLICGQQALLAKLLQEGIHDVRAMQDLLSRLQHMHVAFVAERDKIREQLSTVHGPLNPTRCR